MSRTIIVSTSVFAAIWSQRQDSEETEDEILARLLGVTKSAKALVDCNAEESANEGVCDFRNGVDFPAGFKAFRSYKGNKYVAVASAGFWIRQDSGDRYLSLNRLSESITEGKENVWRTWKFCAEDGTTQPLDLLRKTA